LVAPAVAAIAAILAYPLCLLAVLSLQHYGIRQLFAHQGVWVGIDNYWSLLGDAAFRAVVLRTLIFTFANVAATLVLGTLIALLMERVLPVLRLVVMAGLVLVWATPVVVAVDMWQWMFDYEFGIVNYALTHAGLGNFIHHSWFDNPIQGFTVIGIVIVWGAIPFVTVTLYAGLTQVPREIVEAAEVDGAGPLQVFRYVTVPVLRPIFVILATLSTIWDFQAFNQVWIMLNARPSADYMVMGVYSFVQAFKVSQYGEGAAIAVVMVVVLLLATAFYIRSYLRQAVGGLEGA